jgi:oligoribonuclease (3'-5' exoribonuclease)
MIGPSPIVDQPNWKYVSIDIETLGLDSEYCDVIEVGAVLDDLKTPLDELPQYHCYLTKDDNRYRGEIYAMMMNAAIIERIAKRTPHYTYMPADYLDESFADWLKTYGVKEAVVAGKNFATFDMKFLSKLNFGTTFKIHRRILDVGSMFYDPFNDDVPPNLEECLKRSGIDKKVNHLAVEDALDVVRCIRYKYCN